MQPRKILFTVLFVLFSLAAVSAIPPIYSVLIAKIVPERQLLNIYAAILAFGGVQLIYHGVRQEIWFYLLLILVGVIEILFSLILGFKTSALWDYGMSVLAMIVAFLALNTALNLVLHFGKKGSVPTPSPA